MKYKFCVSGAAVTDSCAPDAMEKTKLLAKEIVAHNGVLVTGATIGVPYWAAVGCKEAGGFSIGISPASSEIEHVKRYRLPIDQFDIIIYTGFGYSGRNLLLTRASDAVITVCGRIGTLNEFTIAFEDHKPIGVLTETGGAADEIKEIVEACNRPNPKIVYDSDPKILIDKLVKLIEAEKKEAKPDTPYDYQEHLTKKNSG